MPEVESSAETYYLNYHCDDCNAVVGATGQTLDGPVFVHRCPQCNKEYGFSIKYPTVRFRPVIEQPTPELSPAPEDPPPHRHRNPSPSQEAGAWCNGTADDHGCGQFVPLSQFPDEPSQFYPDGPKPYLVDGRSSAQGPQEEEANDG